MFDVLVLAGVDLRDEPWEARRERLELLAGGFDYPFEVSPLVEPTTELTGQMVDGRLEGIVLKERSSRYRGGSRAGWTKVKDRGWYEREAWRFDRRCRRSPKFPSRDQRKSPAERPVGLT